jgi:hypothetical protein
VSKVAVSVSMDSDQAERYRRLAQESGRSFSSTVCDLAVLGESASEPPAEEPTLELVPDEPLAEAEVVDEAPDEVEPEVRPPLEPSLPSAKKLKGKSLAVQVAMCVSGVRTPLDVIAAHLGQTGVDVGVAVEELINDGDPIMLRSIAGVWSCWREESA